MKTLLEVLRLCTEYLKERGIDSPRREAEWLLCEALGIKKLQLYLDHDRPLLPEEVATCRAWLKRRGGREPLQYISGKMEFYGCTLHVDSRALIPRQETELIVEQIAKELSARPLEGKVFWDVCTGSGCVAIAIKRHFPALTVVGSDLSSEALTLAASNAQGFSVEWLQGDLLAPMAGRGLADFCFCNPPYLTEGELKEVDPEVRLHEPLAALDGGADGLLFYRRLAAELPGLLNPGALVWLEIGCSQGEAVRGLFGSSPWLRCHVHKDLASHDRWIFLVRE